MKKGDPLTPAQKVAALERTLVRHDRYEERTLADLRVAGYDFKTIESARRYLKARHTLDALPASAIADLLADHPTMQSHRRDTT